MEAMTLEDVEAAQILVAIATPPDRTRDEDEPNSRFPEAKKLHPGSSEDVSWSLEQSSSIEEFPSPRQPRTAKLGAESGTSTPGDQTLWNPIIPEASRTISVDNIVTRKLGRGRKVLSTPTFDRVAIQEQTSRLWAMRQLLGEPVGITDGEIRQALLASRWDLGAALRGINHTLNEARDRRFSCAVDRSSGEVERDRLLGADSLHHNRRLGIDYIYGRLIQLVGADQRCLLTTLTLGELLADHRFDVDEAVEAFLKRLSQPTEVERHEKMERRLRFANPNQLHRDQRIARFMEIAGTEDYYSAKGLIEAHYHDTLKAMDHWMRRGLASQCIPPQELKRALFCRPRRLHTDTEDLWPHPRPSADGFSGIDQDDVSDAEAEYGDPPYASRSGWFVRYPRGDAKLGVHVPTRLSIDYIRLGEFRCPQVITVKRQDGSNVEDPFDYNRSAHVQHLNNISSQWFRRILGERTKERGAFYRDDENDWIWWWHNERYWELVELRSELLNATSAADWHKAGVAWPMRIDLNQLAQDFNERWAIQSSESGADRQARDVRSLDAQRRRIQTICEDFGYPYSPPHLSKETHTKRRRSSDASDGSDSEGKPINRSPRKKR